MINLYGIATVLLGIAKVLLRYWSIGIAISIATLLAIPMRIAKLLAITIMIGHWPAMPIRIGHLQNN